MEPQALVLAAQTLIAASAAFIAWRYLGATRSAAIAAGLLFNAASLPHPLGIRTPIFVHDVCVPALLALLVTRRGRNGGGILWVGVAAALTWPLLGTLLNVAEFEGMTEWVEFLFRRLGFVAFFAVGLKGHFRSIDARAMLDACVLIWIGMCIMGILQYGGMVDTDVWAAADEELRRRSIFESSAAMRGFMGLNRGAVGVWGSAVFAYCLAQLSTAGSLLVRFRVVYGIGAAVSSLVILASGSRTGAIAVVAGGTYVAARLLVRPNRNGVARLVVLGGLIVAAATVIGSYAEIATPAARFAVQADAIDAGGRRAAIQRATVAAAFGDAHTLIVGAGPSNDRFWRVVGAEHGLTHAHSEYVEVLWEAGAPGLVLYLCFLFGLYAQLAPVRNGRTRHIGVAGRAMVIAGMITGLAVGNVFTTSARLATFGLCLAFVYGRMVHGLREASRIEGHPAVGSPLSVAGGVHEWQGQLRPAGPQERGR